MKAEVPKEEEEVDEGRGESAGEEKCGGQGYGAGKRSGEQGGSEPRAREGSAMPETTWAEESRDEGQAVLPLVLVPFEAFLEEEPAARSKQATKTRKLQALTAAQDVLYATPGWLGRIEGARVEASATRADHSEEEASEGLWPYVPDWP